MNMKNKRSNEDYVEKVFYKTGFPALSQPLETSDCENNNNTSDNDDDEDADNDEGYDSEVSLANPYLGANFGFKIMYVHDYSPKLNSNLRSRYNHDQTTKFKQTESY